VVPLNFLPFRAARSARVMLFGQYLIKTGALTPEALLDALDEQQRQVEHFGRIALRLGYLTASQLLRVLDDQVVTRRRVGELAIAHEYMTEQQVAAILKEQKGQRRPIGVVLVRRGVLDEFQLRKHLSDYFATESAVPSTSRSSAALPVEPAVLKPTNSIENT